jgi:hypothetical protein
MSKDRGEGSKHGGADLEAQKWQQPVRPVWAPVLFPLQVWTPLREEPDDATEVR